MAWKYRTLRARETLPESIEDGIELMASLTWTINQKECDLASTRVRAVFSYSKRNLAYGRDKLIVTSGITQLLAPKFQSRYLTGVSDTLNLYLYCRGVEAETTYLGNQFGEVSGGYIWLGCPVIFKGRFDTSNLKHNGDCEIEIESLASSERFRSVKISGT